MKIKIQFEAKNDLSGYEGITRVDDSSSRFGPPNSFKWQCDLDWARGQNIPVKQISIFLDGAFIGRMSNWGTLGNFVEMWENKF